MQELTLRPKEQNDHPALNRRSSRFATAEDPGENRRHRLTLPDLQIGVCITGVGKSIIECEERLVVFGVVPLVADLQAFVVVDLDTASYSDGEAHGRAAIQELKSQITRLN
jgi:hypothetical protein